MEADEAHFTRPAPASAPARSKAGAVQKPPQPQKPQQPNGHRAKRSGWTNFTGRLRRRLLAYREVEFLSTRIPGDPGAGEECLLLVHVRTIVGRVHYRMCPDCARAVITGIVIEERFLAAGLGTRALSHLRSRHPGITWGSTLSLRATRDLLRRMRIPAMSAVPVCSHMPAASAADGP
ncbi:MULTISPECIES: hypothetical protein [Streptomyces]|uniref:N-acetyltransferase n=1 Tax=Streptomyces spororaveus TaxID=284039 RepID=A0ABQ3T5G0_9ACTN|nr:MULTISPECIES: hypothetical protein [Streptomyces]MCM9076573.1 hypothetical protein [Streptomyces spororaveus]MCX5308769.1 hypothetical protein [Streptomyces sp. NBC_00160]GHI75629.1 hypothetical protein Sspor_11900 [Streptomyces spororaveus]